MSISEAAIRAIATILTTIGLMFINGGNIDIGYPLFSIGLFWLTYRENKK